MEELRFIGQMCLLVAAVLAMIVIIYLLSMYFSSTVVFVILSTLFAIIGGIILKITKETRIEE